MARTPPVDDPTFDDVASRCTVDALKFLRRVNDFALFDRVIEALARTNGKIDEVVIHGVLLQIEDDLINPKKRTLH